MIISPDTTIETTDRTPNTFGDLYSAQHSTGLWGQVLNVALDVFQTGRRPMTENEKHRFNL